MTNTLVFMRHIILVLLQFFALCSSAMYVQLFYGPDDDGKYMEFRFNGSNLRICSSTHVSKLSDRDIPIELSSQVAWNGTFIQQNKLDGTFLFYNTFTIPSKSRFTFRSDFSMVCREYINLDTNETTSTILPLVKVFVHRRFGDCDYIAVPGVTEKDIRTYEEAEAARKGNDMQNE